MSPEAFRRFMIELDSCCEIPTTTYKIKIEEEGIEEATVVDNVVKVIDHVCAENFYLRSGLKICKIC